MTSSVKLHDLIPFTSAINFPIMIQAVPTYLNGLYAKETQLLHPWSLAFGSILGLVYVFGMFWSTVLYCATEQKSFANISAYQVSSLDMYTSILKPSRLMQALLEYCWTSSYPFLSMSFSWIGPNFITCLGRQRRRKRMTRKFLCQVQYNALSGMCHVARGLASLSWPALFWMKQWKDSLSLWRTCFSTSSCLCRYHLSLLLLQKVSQWSMRTLESLSQTHPSFVGSHGGTSSKFFWLLSHMQCCLRWSVSGSFAFVGTSSSWALTLTFIALLSRWHAQRVPVWWRQDW